MRYAYKAKRGPNDFVEGRIEAPNEHVAVSKITEQGLVPVLVVEESKYQSKVPIKNEKLKPGPALFKKRVSRSHIYFFTKKLKVLLKSQVPILTSLNILEDQITNKEFKAVMNAIVRLIKEGASFSGSLEKFPQYFSPLYISVIKAGEATGKLDYSLEQISNYLEREKQLSQKVKSSLVYPAVMIAVGAATVIFLMTFVVPKLSVLFEDFVENIPLITKMLLATSVFLSKYWWLLLGMGVGLGFFLYYARNTSWQRNIIEGVKKRTPLVKDIIYNQSLCRFARGLSILLSSGISVLGSIRIATPLIDDRHARKELGVAYEQIISGTGLEESLNNSCTFLPDIFIKMVAIGETSGKLDEVLNELSESYADEVDTKSKIITSLIEPLAVLVVGGILSFIAIAVLLPIFEMTLSI